MRKLASALGGMMTTTAPIKTGPATRHGLAISVRAMLAVVALSAGALAGWREYRRHRAADALLEQVFQGDAMGCVITVNPRVLAAVDEVLNLRATDLVVERLVTALHEDNSPDIQVNIEAALVRVDRPRAVAEQIWILERAADPYERRMALIKLAGLAAGQQPEAQRARAAVVRCLDSADPDLAEYAVSELAELGERSSGRDPNTLRGLLGHRSKLVRARAAHLLGESYAFSHTPARYRSAVTDLAVLLNDDDEAVRRSARQAIVRILALDLVWPPV